MRRRRCAVFNFGTNGVPVEMRGMASRAPRALWRAVEISLQMRPNPLAPFSLRNSPDIFAGPSSS